MAYQKPEVLDKYARQVDNNENLYTANKLAMSQSPYELLSVHRYLLFTRLHVCCTTRPNLEQLDKILVQKL